MGGERPGATGSPGYFLAVQRVGSPGSRTVCVPTAWLFLRVRRPPCVVPRARLPLPDGVGKVRHPWGGLRADRLQGHAARVHALEQADPGAEQHG
jgi:hypothetical protein